MLLPNYHISASEMEQLPVLSKYFLSRNSKTADYRALATLLRRFATLGNLGQSDSVKSSMTSGSPQMLSPLHARPKVAFVTPLLLKSNGQRSPNSRPHSLLQSIHMEFRLMIALLSLPAIQHYRSNTPSYRSRVLVW